MIPGKLVNMEAASISTGGPVSNTGLALIKLGIDAKLMGKIGDDFFGQGVRTLLKDWHADDAMTVVNGEQTSYTLALAPPGIDRIFLHNPGANNTFRADDINYDFVAKARLFHLGYPPLMRALYSNDGAELVEIFRRAKEAGATTSIDMSLPRPQQRFRQGGLEIDPLAPAPLRGHRPPVRRGMHVHAQSPPFRRDQTRGGPQRAARPIYDRGF